MVNDDTDLSGIANQSAEVGGEVEDYDKVKDLTEAEGEEEKEEPVAEGEEEVEAPAVEGEEAEAAS